jgi:hypothetical protein
VNEQKEKWKIFKSAPSIDIYDYMFVLIIEISMVSFN